MKNKNLIKCHLSTMKKMLFLSGVNKGFFTKAVKSSFPRLDKLSIFEYFNLKTARQTASTEDSLILELICYFNSKTYKEEFDSLITTDIQKFKFLLLHKSLLKEKTKENLFKTYQNSNNQLKYYIQQEFNLFNETRQLGNSLLLENQLLELFNREAIKYKKVHSVFLKTLDESDKKLFEESVLYYLLESKTQAEYFSDKFFVYFKAHRNYLKGLSLNEIMFDKIYWGMKDDNNTVSNLHDKIGTKDKSYLYLN